MIVCGMNELIITSADIYVRREYHTMQYSSLIVGVGSHSTRQDRLALILNFIT